jgi:hypothetical protein
MSEFDPSSANKRWMLYVALVALMAWTGFASVVMLPPNELTLPVLFVLLFVCVGSTLMPAIAYLNARFGRFCSEHIYQVRFVRQSILVGAFVVVAAWLQLQRKLSATLGLILLAVFVLTETFLITRESPPKEN